MSTQVRLRRGTTADHATFTGANGEVSVDTTKKTIVVHDGITAGGVPALPESVAPGQIAAQAQVTPTRRSLPARLATGRAVAGLDFGIKADGSSDDAPAINAILAALSERGGGVLELPVTGSTIRVGSPIDNKYSRALVRGAGFDSFHNIAENGYYGTNIVPLPGFAGSAVLKHRSVYGANKLKLHGGGFEFLRVTGGARALEVDSISSGLYDLDLLGQTGPEAALFKCGETGIDLGEATDIQFAKIHLRVRVMDPGSQNTDAVVFKGSATANVSLVFDIVLDIQHWNGDAFIGDACDNCHVILRAGRPGGTGKTVLMKSGGTGRGLMAGITNVFKYLSGNGPIYAEGSEVPGGGGVINKIIELDTSNGTPDPTAGAGSFWEWRDSNNVHNNARMLRLDAIEAYGSFGKMRDKRVANPNVSQIIVNGSFAHQLYAVPFGAAEWSVGVDQAKGDFRFSYNGDPAGAKFLVGAQIACTGLFFGTNQVVGPRGAAVANASGAGDVVQRLNDLLARLRDHGLIAP